MRRLITSTIACICGGGVVLREIAEDIAETMSSVPRSSKAIQIAREKFTCRSCQKISQAAAPFHVITTG